MHLVGMKEALPTMSTTSAFIIVAWLEAIKDLRSFLRHTTAFGARVRSVLSLLSLVLPNPK